jgi:hypothetical protein
MIGPMIPKPMRGCKFGDFLDFLGQINSPANCRQKVALKLYFLGKNGCKPIQSGHYEVIFTHRMSAKPQHLPKSWQISPL